MAVTGHRPVHLKENIFDAIDQEPETWYVENMACGKSAV